MRLFEILNTGWRRVFVVADTTENAVLFARTHKVIRKNPRRMRDVTDDAMDHEHAASLRALLAKNETNFVVLGNEGWTVKE